MMNRRQTGRFADTPTHNRTATALPDTCLPHETVAPFSIVVSVTPKLRAGRQKAKDVLDSLESTPSDALSKCIVVLESAPCQKG
jgi:hypothetical protein